MTSSQEDFIVESTPVVDLKATGLVHSPDARIEPKLGDATPVVSSLSHWDSEKTEVLADADADAVAWLTDDSGQKHIIGKFPFFLGRSADCDVVLNGKGVSRKHAEIVFQSGRLVVNDLESLNGLKVNGYKVARVILEDSDEIRLGDVSLRFHTAAGNAKEKPPAKAKAETGKPKKAEKAPKPAKPVEAASNKPAATSNVFRYVAMVSVMADVVGMVYVTANFYSKRRHVEEAILPDPSQDQAKAVAAAGAAPAAQPTQQAAAPADPAASAKPSEVVAVAPSLSGTAAPPPPPDDSGTALPPPAPFAPPAFNNDSVGAAPPKATAKPKKPEPVKVGRTELYPAPETVVTPAVKRPETVAVASAPVSSSGDSKLVQSAQLQVSQADDRYLRGDAPALLKELSALEASPGLPAEERGRVSRKLNSIQSLYSFYVEGKEAYARGEKERAFSTWSNFLAKERSAYPGKRSVYASGVGETVSGEYMQQADAANKAGNSRDAYRLLQKASDSGNASARAKIDALNMQAQNLYRDALRQEYVNSTKARELWQKVVEIVPEDNEYHVKASGKLAYYSRWSQ